MMHKKLNKESKDVISSPSSINCNTQEERKIPEFNLGLSRNDDHLISRLIKEAGASGNLNEVKRLIETEGVPVTAQNGFSNHAIHLAAAFNRLPIVQYLIQMKSPLNHQNYHKKTPLHLAVEYNFAPIVKLLLDNYALPDLVNSDNRRPSDLSASSHIQKMLFQAIEREKNRRLVRLFLVTVHFSKHTCHDLWHWTNLPTDIFKLILEWACLYIPNRMAK